jgi:hypothetical protein
MAAQDASWATTIAPGITCRMCFISNPTTLLSAEELLLQNPLSFVQHRPCGHVYCTQCYEKLLFASAQHPEQSLPCQAPDCRRQVLVTKEAVCENNVVLEMGERRLPLPSGKQCQIWELRVSVLSQNELIEPGHVCCLCLRLS